MWIGSYHSYPSSGFEQWRTGLHIGIIRQNEKSSLSQEVFNSRFERVFGTAVQIRVTGIQVLSHAAGKLELKLNVLFRYSKRTRKIPWRFLLMWKTSRRWGTIWDTLWPLSTWEPWGLTSLWLSTTSSSHFSVVLLKLTIHYVDPMTSFTIICPNDWVTRPVVSFNLH